MCLLAVRSRMRDTNRASNTSRVVTIMRMRGAGGGPCSHFTQNAVGVSRELIVDGLLASERRARRQTLLSCSFHRPENNVLSP